MRAARALLCAAALAAVGALAPLARASGALADRDAARTLAGQGYELYEAGQLQRAIVVFRQAEARFHAPPHLLYVARAQVKLGRLLEAEGTYKLVADEKLASDAPGPFKEAQVSARAELAQLQALVPSLVITLAGVAPPGTRVLLDGELVDAEHLGLPTRLNPGSHTVRAEPPGLSATERAVVLEAGGREARVSLSLARPSSRSVVPAVIAFSVGVAGVGVGTTAAILSIHAAPASVSRLRAAEIAGFVAGGAGIVAGVVLLAVRARAPGASAAPAAYAPARVRIAVGLGALSVAGDF